MSSERRDVLAVIPARMGAQRFPGKPLAMIAGKPLVRWVWEAAAKARRVTRVVVATDSDKIAKAVRAFGGEPVMTSPRCPSGTDRVAEVARGSRAGIIVNVQGDEPLLSPECIDAVVAALQQDHTAVMATAVRKPASEREWRSPNAVKAVLDRMNYALYFSRAPIPSAVRRDRRAHTPRWIHLGLYGFRRAFLFRFAGLPPTALEQEERLEQLRVLEHGCAIKVVIVPQRTCSVDEPQDVGRVERILATGQR
ncbi:MAG TPA: 3-deoxy-manno-octulosonate cytidylyltransferase [Elusimicrobiota bacterium]|nr:3-deoxy-manno-octulosonate cytidylyltransferase [Elusimicrobiota bacterium]